MPVSIKGWIQRTPTVSRKRDAPLQILKRLDINSLRLQNDAEEEVTIVRKATQPVAVTHDQPKIATENGKEVMAVTPLLNLNLGPDSKLNPLTLGPAPMRKEGSRMTKISASK